MRNVQTPEDQSEYNVSLLQTAHGTRRPQRHYCLKRNKLLQEKFDLGGCTDYFPSATSLSLPMYAVLQRLLTSFKCDEDRPICSNCTRYCSVCVYPSTGLDTSQESSASIFMASPFTTPESILDDSSISQRSTHDLPTRELALMHQWSVSTCYGFGNGFSEDGDPWRIDIPILAQHFPFLMRGILAVTSLHLSKSTMDHNLRSQYVNLAAYHQDIALPEYRGTLVDVTEANVTAVLAFSVLTVIYSFATTKDSGALYTSGCPEWLLLSRGVGQIPPHWESWIERGCLGPQTMHRRKLHAIDAKLHPEDYRLVALHSVLTTLSPDEQHEATHYKAALYWLRQAFAHAGNPESRISPMCAIMYWVERISQEFLDLLVLQKPRAIVLMAHFCVLMRRASNYWYVAGAAEDIMVELQRTVHPKFLPWMEWPMQVFGMV
jgi:hypothetical protein